MTAKTKPEAPVEQKSAADLLIEMQLKKEQEAATNPLAIDSIEEASPNHEVRTDQGAKLVKTVKFSNGTEARHFA